MHIELTDQEASVLLQLLDGSVKFYGLNAAQSAAHFQAKIQAAKETIPMTAPPLDKPQ